MNTEAVALVLKQVALVFYVAVGVFGCATIAFLGLKFLLWDAPRAVAAWLSACFSSSRDMAPICTLRWLSS